ncbi:uncharacterized protein LOC129602276 [Paramacrobiotus metropolitanus]|uniref:uncharacterized protein LOC129602276 n=1 Tax=Paramacrobiotus metropolitanus TaxID=2943436 RepID=UPI0024461E22|nr:uncharacterized protein LOC129602276 [Paramacrobiotus metropolitanus]
MHTVLDVNRLHYKIPYDREFSVENRIFEQKLVALLNSSPSQHTRSMTFTDDGQFRHLLKNRYHYRLSLLHCTKLLKLKAVRLPLIIIKNYGDAWQIGRLAFLSLTRNDQSGEFECRQLANLMPMCDQLLLVNYTASIPSAKNSLLTALHGFNVGVLTWLEDGHKIQGPEETSAHLNVLIPFLRFRRTESTEEQCRRLVASVNENCPAVSPDVYAKVSGVHARWVRTLIYPGQWTGIRMFLDLFSSVRPDGQPQRWDEVDLRQIDVSLLSPLALHILDGYFAD